MEKILLIEDEKGLGEMYQNKFLNVGFEVFWASSIEDGLDLAKKEKPDLILLDILLKNEDGIVFLEKLRNDKQIAQLPVVVFSNYDVPKLKQRAFSLGAWDYLLKVAYTPQQVVEKIKMYLK